MFTYEATWASGSKVSWRGLTFEEFLHIRALPISSVSKYAMVYGACVLNGLTIDYVTAGVVLWIGKRELDFSPFNDTLDTINHALIEKRKFVENNYLCSAHALVMYAFNYKMDEIRKMDQDEFFTRLAQAEFITGRKLDPVDPRAIERQQKGRKQTKPIKGMGWKQDREQPSIEVEKQETIVSSRKR